MSQPSFTARNATNIAGLSSACLVLPIFKDRKLEGDIAKLDTKISGAITRAIALGDFTAEAGTAVALLGNDRVQRILLLGCGSADDFDLGSSKKLAQAAGKNLASTKAREAHIALEGLPLSSEDSAHFLETLATEILWSCYVYTETLSKPKNVPSLAKVSVTATPALTIGKVRKALNAGVAIGEGVNFTRQLGNLPANICTPTYLSKQARALGRKHSKLSVSILDEKKMRELGMGSLLSVGHGSDEPSQLIVMEYKGGKAKEAPYALVGKGITFDTGGISLKPGGKMDEMKFDMGGASSVFGTVQAVVNLDLPINLVGIVAAAENMPSGRATKPGDVVKSMSGQTIEILNTDAEGRLVLCDALTYLSLIHI